MGNFQVRNARWSSLGGISLAGQVRASGGSPSGQMRVLGSYAVVYLMSGGGRFADDTGLRTSVTAGDLIVLFPDIPHSYGPVEGSTWSELYFVFDGPVFDLWRQKKVLDPRRPIHHIEPIDQWATAFSRVLSAEPEPGAAPALAEICRLQAVLAEALAADQTDPRASTDRDWLARATALLDMDPRREAKLEDVATQLGFSYDGFRKRFRRLAGMSPARYRSMRSIDRACELMATTQWTDRQIAAELGFCDEFHFSHRFTDITGRTPREFRATLPPRGSRTYK